MTPTNAKDDAVEAVALKPGAPELAFIAQAVFRASFADDEDEQLVKQKWCEWEADRTKAIRTAHFVIRALGGWGAVIAAIEAMRAAQPVEDDAVETVTDKMIGAGWVVMSKAFGRDVPDRTIRAFYLAMRAAHVTAQEGKEDK
jgi:hypothetical protein